MQNLLKTGYRLLRSGTNIKANPSQSANENVTLQLRKAQRAWLKHMESLKDPLGVVILPDHAPELNDNHLKHCQLVPNREGILRRMKKGAVVAEVGVQEGQFSKAILELCKPSKLHLIDFHLTRYAIAEKFAQEINDERVVLHEQDSSTAISTFPDRYFDFIYIDADHSYEGVEKDINAAISKIKDDGYLIFNDYTYWSPGECINYGVVQAVNELCVEQNWEFVYFALAGYMYCDVAIAKIHANR